MLTLSGAKPLLASLTPLYTLQTHIVGLEQQVERARTELEELRAPSSWLYFTIALLLIVILYWGIDVNYPLSYV